MIESFTRFLHQQNLSPKTIRNYRSDLAQFLRWVGPTPLQPEVFIAYKNHLRSQNTPLATLNRHLSALRKFAQFSNLPVNLDNPPLPHIPTTLKNFRSHLTKNRYKHKTIANYISDVKHYLHWAQNHA